MDCQAVKEDLVAFLDSEVSAALRVEIEAHLKACPDCAREARALAASWQMLDKSLPPGPGADFTASVMRRVRQVPEQAASPDGRERPWLFLFGVAGILVVFLAGLIFWDHLCPAVKAPVALLPVPGTDLEPEGLVESHVAPQMPVEVPLPQVAPVMPEIAPVAVPQVLPMAPATVGPIAHADQDRDIIANLDMYENADMLKKMDDVSDMDVLESMEEASS